MTSSSLRARSLAVAAVLLWGFAHLTAYAALGEHHVDAPAAGAAAVASVATKRSVAAMARYTVHDVQRPDGSLIREYVAPSGLVFAVSWNTLYKPNLSTLLGASFPSYANAAQTAGQRGGIQRQFRVADADLVVQSTGHLHVFAGHAYLHSQLPQGVTPQTLGWE